jgi:hypothetical protein
MTTDDWEARIDRAISKGIRLAVENSRGQFSASWIFWGRKNDFYFGAKSVSGEIKVSLHENGRGYLGYDKLYFQRKQVEGIAIPAKTIREWALPVPNSVGAVHAASLLLPADFCFGPPLTDRARRNTFVLGIEDGSCAENGAFLSHEHPTTLGPKLDAIAKPMFTITLDNELHVWLVARAKRFDPACLPSKEQTARARSLALISELRFDEPFNAIAWDAPVDGGAIRVIDVGGVRLQRTQPQPALPGSPDTKLV